MENQEPVLLDEGHARLPAVMARNERVVRAGFWTKLRKVSGRIPFAEEVAAAYFCAVDRRTPARVRAVLLAAVAYFVLPTDFIPDFIAGLGFTDDATVLTVALGIVSGHIKDRHHRRAREALLIPEPAADLDDVQGR